MLARTTAPTADFAALARYLIIGRARPPDPGRVSWIDTHNLASDDPDFAARLMSATAALNPRTLKAAYHLMISWSLDDDRPSPDTMKDIARRTLSLAGLGEYQALVVGHGDTPHDHLHMLINRVHPDTGKTWKPSHDWKLFDRIMRQLADEHGFRAVPAHAFNPELTGDLQKKPNRAATYAAKRGASTERLQWSRVEADDLGARVSEQLGASSTWADVETALADHGLELEAKGHGYVAGNAVSYVKLSSLGLTKTAMGFEKRPSRRKRRSGARASSIAARNPFTVDEVDIARALVAWGVADRSAIQQAVSEAIRVREARLSTTPFGLQFLMGFDYVLRSETALRARNNPIENHRRKKTRKVAGLGGRRFR